ncbi:MAG TPA: glycosyltransferase [Tepidisphaeraceae bacterium]|nr:glycosyltransferase [Tepidisphaeraceae bacterium]
MVIVHLTASPFFGGPERQMLGLALHLPKTYQSVFFSFAERGLCRPFLEQLRKHGFSAKALKHNTPHLLAAARELAYDLRHLHADALCCHGYKPDIVGWLAARRVDIPVLGISRGWTAVTQRVRFYEALDRRILRRMDCVVCVSEGQAAKVRHAGVPPSRVVVIRNAIQTDRFSNPNPIYRRLLQEYFPEPRSHIVCAVGRLSPEKGFGQLIEAARIVAETQPGVGFVLFGDGPLRRTFEQQIIASELQEKFILAGFRDDVDRFIPHADLVAIPSLTEGLPNVALEAHAAGVPIVATAVGGTPEVVENAGTGYLVPPGDPAAFARGVLDLLADETQRLAMGRNAQQRIREQFTFETQSAQYQRLFQQLLGKPSSVAPTPQRSS